MDSAIQQGGSGQMPGQVVMTARGWIVLLAIAGAVGFGGYAEWQRLHPAEYAGGVAHQMPPRTVAPAQPSGAVGGPLPQFTGASSQQLSDELVRERHTREIQASAWRAAAEANKHQLEAMADSLQSLEERVDVIQKAVASAPAATPQAPQARATRDGVAQVVAVSHSIHQALDTARAAAGVDVTALPLQAIPAQAMNITGFGNGVVQIGGQSLSVGQALQKGEIIVAIDPESHSIVTNQRIINVTN
ncbi:hypothetical protein AB4Y43_16815 [Paraburkholderia sp. BR10872]|uniref:hypothetical protein n=1 Tax=Paraburkholderia sp. BR10872 TaxID=3236989 RepID=UPI0034D1E699